MKQWSEERCAERPEELQVIAPGLYMQRRNIREVKHEADEATGMGPYTDYVCESREITESEYEMLKSIEKINTDEAVTAAIDEYTMQLMEGGIL